MLGIAIRGMDDDYVCGLNTLLDHVEIPWKYGRNKMVLEYRYGVLLVGGRYYFDAAIFDKTVYCSHGVYWRRQIDYSAQMGKYSRIKRKLGVMVNAD